MKRLFAMIGSFVRRIFCRETMAEVWRVLFGGAKSAVASILADAEIMDAAIEIVRSVEIDRAGQSGEDKADHFNAAFKTWARGQGLQIGASTLNAVREVCVAALKAECETSVRA